MSLKFHEDVDANLFLAEVHGKFNSDKIVDRNYEPTNEEIQSFIKKRDHFFQLKNSKKSVVGKLSWAANRSKIMKGINRFHKSVEGKRFHKKLGRFLATRIIADKRPLQESVWDRNEYLTGLNSLKQHLTVELSYFHSVYEHVEIEEMVLNHALPMFQGLEQKVINQDKLSDDEISFLADTIEQKEFVDNLASALGQSEDSTREWVNSIMQEVEQSTAKESPDYWTSVVKKIVDGTN